MLCRAVLASQGAALVAPAPPTPTPTPNPLAHLQVIKEVCDKCRYAPPFFEELAMADGTTTVAITLPQVPALPPLPPAIASSVTEAGRLSGCAAEAGVHGRPPLSRHPRHPRRPSVRGPRVCRQA